LEGRNKILMAGNFEVSMKHFGWRGIGRRYSIPLNVDSYNLAVFYVQSEFPPEIVRSASEIENSLRWHFARPRS
jgi:hypothetical protein